LTWRNYRDPLHNIISLDESVPEDKLLVELIDSAEFQRLRRIRQLGLAMFTYQGAEHSRFTHSLGVMHLMSRALDLLSQQHRIDPEARLIGRVGALLHDLGHGPFSHVIEKLLSFHHEDWTREIILDPGTEVNCALREFDRSLPEKLASLYEHIYKPAFITQMVSSQLDCDRMDYLLRDSLMTGAKYGIYDVEWILHALRIDEPSDLIYVERKGIHAVEEYLQARYHMFRQVYFHRTLRSAEAVLTSALKRARELILSGALRFHLPGSPLDKALLGQQLSVTEYLQLDDADLIFHLKQWCHERDPILSDLAKRFTHRRLFKAADLPDGKIQSFQQEASRIISSAGFDPNYYLVMDSASDIPYYSYYSPTDSDPRELIYVQMWPHSGICEISEVSDVVRGMRSYRLNRACFPAEVAEPIFKLASALS
jgi:hypothetical protein